MFSLIYHDAALGQRQTTEKTQCIISRMTSLEKYVSEKYD